MLRNGFLAFATTVACAGFSSAQTLPWTDVAAASNVTTPTSFSHVLARGAACADFNGDGLVDLVVPDEPGSSFDVYLNLGGWFFIDISPVAGFGPTVQAKGFAPADYDNDGDQDLFICVKGGPCRLLQNNGMMMFVDVANAAGVDFVDDAFHATWGDYDGDGRLDLYVGVRRIPGAPASNRLFRNVGDGTFEDVTVAAGVAHDSLTFSCMWFDYDADGLLDLLVASDLEFDPTRRENALYRNLGDGTFADVGPIVGFDQPMQAMGIDVADVNNDGRPCVFLSNTSVSMGGPGGSPTTDGHVMLHWDPQTQTFERVEQTLGTRLDDVGWASFFFDYDCDGNKDLFVRHMGSPSALLRNPGGGPFTNVGVASGFVESLVECAAGYGDFDNDGYFDVVEPRCTLPICLRRNPYATTGANWLKVKLVGTTSNRDGFGAKVTAATADDVVRTMWKRSGSGFLVANESIVHFGLGANAAATSVTIAWPSGTVQTLTNVAANQTLTVVEPALLASAESAGSRVWQLASPHEPLKPFVAALSLSLGGGLTVGSKTVPIAPDVLFWATLQPGNPFAAGNVGVLDAAGVASGSFWAPPIPELAGLRIYGAAMTLDLSPILDASSVIGPFSFTL